MDLRTLHRKLVCYMHSLSSQFILMSYIKEEATALTSYLPVLDNAVAVVPRTVVHPFSEVVCAFNIIVFILGRIKLQMQTQAMLGQQDGSVCLRYLLPSLMTCFISGTHTVEGENRLPQVVL